MLSKNVAIKTVSRIVRKIACGDNTIINPWIVITGTAGVISIADAAIARLVPIRPLRIDLGKKLVQAIRYSPILLQKQLIHIETQRTVRHTIPLPART